MSVIPITSIAQFRQIIAEDRVSIIDFWAAWCGPCRTMNPVFEKLSSESPSVRFYKVDIDACQDIANEVGIRSIPAFFAYKGGAKLGEPVVGADRERLTNLVTIHR